METIQIEKVKKMVPELRFKGFDQEWESKTLSQISELTSSKRVYLTDYVEKGIPFYRGKEISELKLGRTPSDILFITESSYNDFKTKFGVPVEGDLLITAVGTLGNVLRIKDDSKFYFKDGNLIWIRKIKENSFFLELLLFVYKNEIEKNSIGSTQRALTMVELRKLFFPFPSLPEQQKIASFLTAVDEKLTAFKRKKALLEQYKKGVMQQLFSQELRFKDENGKDFVDWEEKKLGEIATKSTIRNKANKINLVFTNSATQGIVNQRDYFDKDIANQNNLINYYIVEKDDFIYNPRISNHAPVGPIKRNNIGTGVMSPLYSAFKFSVGNLHYFESYFETTHWHEYMESIANYGARFDRMNISMVDFFNMPIPFPTIQEQTLIANFLTSIDEKINFVQEQITKTEKWKKGLLQQLFC
jgi:type I restriction enzyme S subunit